MKRITKLKQKLAVALFSLGTVFSLSSCDLLPSNNNTFYDFVLVQGYVINEENEGICDVTLTLKDYNNTAVGTSTTNEEGFFEFYNVEVGQYDFNMIIPGGYQGQDVSIMVNGTSSTYNIKICLKSEKDMNWSGLY